MKNRFTCVSLFKVIYYVENDKNPYKTFFEHFGAIIIIGVSLIDSVFYDFGGIHNEETIESVQYVPWSQESPVN